MIDFNMDKFIKNHLLYHRLMYIAMMFLAVIMGLFKIVDSTNLIICTCFVVAVFFVCDFVLVKLNYFDSISVYLIIRFSELLFYSAVQPFILNEIFIAIPVMIFCVLISVEFVIYFSDMDVLTINFRKMMIIIPTVVAGIVGILNMDEAAWLAFMLAHAIMLMVIFYIVEWFVKQNSIYEDLTYKLNIEKSEIESTNEKLVEYQERVKTINEKINYQKIDLARVNKELEQANIEIESQSEIMRYMASTFDVLKCINVITDTVMEVKKPKLCALYIDKDVFMNKYGSCIIKTNYTSMQRRLKKEIEDIYSDVVEKKLNSVTYTGVELKKFKFIGEVNINSMAVMPLIDGSEYYGVMLVGSDDTYFFSKGLKYYESCIIEFNVSVKSTQMYLKMEEMARKDGLTGIYNRIYFTELFAEASKTAVEDNCCLSVALFDIDKFKNVNDTYGHLAGDMVIKMVASIAEKYAEERNGFACRYGGEEFLVVFPDYDDKMALEVLEKMHEEIKSTPVNFNGTDISINVCIGLSTYPSLCDNTNILISRADKAMYYGKKSGRGRLVVDNPQVDE
ncbi:MAG: diguanylate cyclase [Lachnospiraceae bacterium]|nr:diguanylate cyclase [Lachnospiraceae bacterium]